MDPVVRACVVLVLVEIAELSSEVAVPLGAPAGGE